MSCALSCMHTIATTPICLVTFPGQVRRVLAKGIVAQVTDCHILSFSLVHLLKAPPNMKLESKTVCVQLPPPSRSNQHTHYTILSPTVFGGPSPKATLPISGHNLLIVQLNSVLFSIHDHCN